MTDASTWQTLPLGAVVGTIVPQRDKPTDLDGPIPWLRIEDFDGKYLGESKSGQGVTQSQVTQMPLRVFPEGTVVCSCSCTMGATAIATRPLVTNQTFIGLVPGPRIDASFLYYLMQAKEDELQQRASGSIQQYLSKSEFRALRVSLPPVEEQRRIADFLDDQVTRVDAAMSLRVEQSQSLADAFVSRLTQTMLASTDRRVEMRRLLLRRPEYGANESAEFEDRHWPRYIRTTDVTSDGQLRTDTFRSLPPEVAAPYLLSEGDVLFTRSGTVGKSFIYRREWGPAAYAGYLIRVTANTERVLPEWIKYFSETSAYWSQIGESAIQATIQNVSADRYASLRLPVPDLPTQRTLVSKFTGWTSYMRSLTQEVDSSLTLLEERKRVVITAAVTGELDVTTARPIGVGKWVPNVGASVERATAAQAQAPSIGGIG